MTNLSETKTYDLTHVIEVTGAPSQDWVKRRINAGLIPARRAGRKWRMTESDIAALVEYMKRPARTGAAAATAPVPTFEGPVGLTPRARRNLHRQTA
ncbi:hypothetical protein [Nocardia sp. CC201C]|uniref:hypothetical protein n=1 Tax=Nocardia sp. CC201C TaxID=3044575 RepID=UPI0024A908B0|nr:hypothetical protein [Nocardia sp. CC201C]